MAARLNPHSGAAEYFSGGRFLSPEEGQTISAALCLQKRPGETWQAGADFGLSVRTYDGWMPLDLSELSWQGNCMTVLLCPGIYRVLTDNRLPNGDLRAARLDFQIDAGKTACVQLQKQPVAFAELAVDFTLADFEAEALGGRKASAAELTQELTLLLWLDAGSEPTEPLLNELLASRERIRGLHMVFFLCARQVMQNEKLRAVLAAFPEAEVWLSADSAEPGGAKRLYRPGQTAAADSVRPPAPYHPCLRRIPRRQRRHRAGLLSAGNKVTIHWIFSENAGTDKFVRPFQAGAETYENGLF